MKTTLLKSVLLFISIPLINSVGFGIASLFHEMYQSTISAEQFESYRIATITMLFILAISIPAIEVLHDKSIINNKTANGFYFLVFVVIAAVTFNQFLFRPYEHSLTFLSIITLVFSRQVLHSFIPKFNRNKKETALA